MKNKKGFTLIELLVVIAIIGLLSSVVLVSLNAARAKGRDAKRDGDLDSVYTSLELFYNAYGRYPSTADGNCSYTNSFASGGCMNVLVTAGYLPRLPTDPSPGGQYYYDNWCSSPAVYGDQSFRLWVAGETNHNGLSKNWWSDVNYGHTTCTDPS